MTRSTGKAESIGIGLDVGSRGARLVVAGRSPAGEPILHKAAVAELPGSPAPALRQLLGGIPRRSPGVRCNLGPVGVIVQEAAFPRMSAAELRGAARIEAEQLIPDIDSMVLDFQVIGSKIDPQTGAEKTTVLIIAASRQAIHDRRALFASADISLSALVPDGIALANCVVALRPPEKGAVLALDIGLEGTTVVAVPPEGEALAPIVRFVPGGVQLLDTEAASEQAAPDARDRQARRERWLREVERSVEFISAKLAAPARELLVVGDGSTKPALLSWLAQTFPQMSVSAWNALKELKRGPGAPSDEFMARCGPHSAIAVGLALM